MNLSKDNLKYITSSKVIKPSDYMFALPEKVLQFGTGVLLRGLLLSALIGFESSVAEKLGCLLKTGANQTLFRMLNGKFI